MFDIYFLHRTCCVNNGPLGEPFLLTDDWEDWDRDNEISSLPDYIESLGGKTIKGYNKRRRLRREPSCCEGPWH